MTEAELVQHFWSSVENAISTTIMYISVFSGYLIIAYLVGARLTPIQALITTGAFVVFGVWCMWGATVFWNSAYVVGMELHHIRPELVPLDLNPAVVCFTLLSIGVFGALKFMWDVRHPKT